MERSLFALHATVLALFIILITALGTLMPSDLSPLQTPTLPVEHPQGLSIDSYVR